MAFCFFFILYDNVFESKGAICLSFARRCWRPSWVVDYYANKQLETTTSLTRWKQDPLLSCVIIWTSQYNISGLTNGLDNSTLTVVKVLPVPFGKVRLHSMSGSAHPQSCKIIASDALSNVLLDTGNKCHWLYLSLTQVLFLFLVPSPFFYTPPLCYSTATLIVHSGTWCLPIFTFFFWVAGFPGSMVMSISKGSLILGYIQSGLVSLHILRENEDGRQVRVCWVH